MRGKHRKMRCKAVTTKGKHCPWKTTFGNYCAHHRKMHSNGNGKPIESSVKVEYSDRSKQVRAVLESNGTSVQIEGPPGRVAEIIDKVLQ